MSSTKNHWENVYTTKLSHELSWTQQEPTLALRFVDTIRLTSSSRIIDVGGGDSKLVDYLLAKGFSDITVLDISSQALLRAQERLGDAASRVKWIECDITDFQPKVKYDFWHDRATFHFLTEADEVDRYLSLARTWVESYLLISTFSENGPMKCSSLGVKRYSETDLSTALENGFEKIECSHENHVTPFRTVQSFLCCSFRKSKQTSIS